jgi:hypothetical protein
VTLRQATADDAPKIAEIWQQGWRDGHLGFVPEELVAARQQDSFGTRAAQRINDTTVAVVDGTSPGLGWSSAMRSNRSVWQHVIAARAWPTCS